MMTWSSEVLTAMSPEFFVQEAQLLLGKPIVLWLCKTYGIAAER